MPMVQVNCRDCGEVTIPGYVIYVMRCVETGSDTYIFICPVCCMRECRPADAHIVDILRSTGACERLWHLPPELTKSIIREGPPITIDDVLDFTAALRTLPDDEILANAERQID